MRTLLWLVAVICIVIWILGFFGIIAGISTSGLFHVLLVIAGISILYNIIAGKRLFK